MLLFLTLAHRQDLARGNKNRITTRAHDGGGVYVCVFLFSFILDVKFVGCIPAEVTQEEGHTGFLTHLPSAVCIPLFFSREGCSRSFLSSTMKSNFVCQRFNRSLLVGYFYLVRKSPSYRDWNSRLNVSEGYEVTN